MGIFGLGKKQADSAADQGYPELEQDIRRNGKLPPQQVIAVKGNARNFKVWWDGEKWVQEGEQYQHGRNGRKR